MKKKTSQVHEGRTGQDRPSDDNQRSMVKRCCTTCQRSLLKTSFSKNQWSKGVGTSRCSACVHGGGPPSAPSKQRAPTARENNSFSASFTEHNLRNPFAEGSFRWVSKGTYTSGERDGEPCVCKWFKTGGVCEESFFKTDILAAERSLKLIDEFNNTNIVNQVIRMNLPQVWTFTATDGNWGGKKVLQEPYIEKYQKFNSNTGWADDRTPWPKVMQALSHFTYHKSAGQFVLCDLQGGILRNGVVLTDPVILSRQQNQYGVTDLGIAGISNFFHHHVCNEFCKSHWQKPKDRNSYFQKSSSTSMIASKNVPSHPSRQYMTGLTVLQEAEDGYSSSDDEGYGW